MLGILLPTFTVDAAVIDDDLTDNPNVYSWGIKYNNDYPVEPYSLGYDFSGSSYDDDGVIDYASFFDLHQGLSFGAYSTTGSINVGVATYRQLFIETIYGSGDLFIDVYGFSGTAQTYSFIGSATLTDIADEIPFLLIGFDFISNSDSSSIYIDNSITFRIGNKSARLVLSSLFDGLDFQQATDASATFDPGFKFYSDVPGGTTINPTTTFSTVDLYLGNNASATSLTLDRILELAYDAGFEQGAVDGREQVDGLLDLMALIAGVVINFILFIATLEVYGISLLTVFTTVLLFVGLVWILKLIRG
jgi:hypothetical protein